MSEAVRASTALEGLLAQVEALRSNAAGHDTAVPRPDPVRLHYVEALARRLEVAPPAVQKLLQAKLAQALKALGCSDEADAQEQPVAPAVANDEPCDALSTHAEPVDVIATAPTPAPRKPRSKAQAETAQTPLALLSLLGQLNQHIQTASAQAAAAGPAQATNPSSLPDLKSAVRFRETWARISAETEVDQAGRRAPENAGPLNAHSLVLRTLSLMRELSPDYLRRFLSHTESLLWLDQAYGQLKQPASKVKAAKVAKAKP